MASKYWIKLYHEMLDDPKIGQLRPALRWRFIECLLVAGECDEDGFIPESKKYAWRVRASEEVVDTELTELAQVGLLSRTEGKWKVSRFSDRQAPVPPTERWRQWRDRQREDEYKRKQTDFKRIPNGSANESLDRRDIDTEEIEIRDNQREMESALGIVAVEDLLLKKPEFEELALALLDAGYTPEQIRGAYGKGGWWYSQSFGSKNGRKPWLSNIRGSVKEAVSASTLEVSDV